MFERVATGKAHERAIITVVFICEQERTSVIPRKAVLSKK